MSTLRELYHEVIVDHGRKPRNFMVMDNANHIKEGFNPLCGDKITLFLYEKEGLIEKATFQGSGCAISIASASLMTEAVKGKTLTEAKKLFADFHDLVMNKADADTENLGKLTVLGGVCEFPSRVKCATLAWHALLGVVTGLEK